MTTENTEHELIAPIKNGSRRALAQGLTLLENGDAHFKQSLSQQIIPPYYSIGFTGPPGAGKSTLIDLVLENMATDKKMAVLASDPSSPFSGGALLGDRYRRGHKVSDNVYYRSIASRGQRGSLSSLSRSATRLLALAGYEWLFYESIGAGQNEIDIQSLAHGIALVLVPEAGDSTQAMKSGILELADIIIVNKSDRPGAKGFQEDLETVMSQRQHNRDPNWTPHIVSTSASENKGITELIAVIEKHQQHYLSTDNPVLRKKQRVSEITEILMECCQQQLLDLTDDKWAELINAFEENHLDPQQFIKNIFE